MLGRVAEVASGRPLDVFIKERLLDKIGMGDTAFWYREPDRDLAAVAMSQYLGDDEAILSQTLREGVYGALVPPVVGSHLAERRATGETALNPEATGR